MFLRIGVEISDLVWSSETHLHMCVCQVGQPEDPTLQVWWNILTWAPPYYSQLSGTSPVLLIQQSRLEDTEKLIWLRLIWQQSQGIIYCFNHPPVTPHRAVLSAGSCSCLCIFWAHNDFSMQIQGPLLWWEHEGTISGFQIPFDKG